MTKRQLLLHYVRLLHDRMAGIAPPYDEKEWDILLDRLTSDSDRDVRIKDLVLRNALSIMNMPGATPAMASGVQTMVINHLGGPSPTARGKGIFSLVTRGMEQAFNGIDQGHASVVSQALVLEKAIEVEGRLVQLVTMLPRTWVPVLINTEHQVAAEWLLSLPEPK